jgi:NADH-quinone oxidoreductase subunit L
MRNMGGLAPYLPITRWTFLLSCFAIAGVPPFAGFWSKDEILWKAYELHVTTDKGTTRLPMWTWPDWLGPAIYWVGIVAATMTAFYMFRAYFMTFHGEFKGWTIVKGWKGHGHGHHEDEHDDGPIQGPVPHESPLAMTVPLMVLAAFAVGAGFLNASPLHVEPIGHLLEPVFAKAEHLGIAERPGVEKLEYVMMVPGILAFLVGGGLAYVVYMMRGGVPEREFARSFPRLYKLIYDKWRIDELYDATVVGMVDALADIFTMADRWIIDGVLAKVSSAVVAASGTVLRALQTGRVQAYAASMVIGIAGLGWFLVRPHSAISIDDKSFKASGVLTLSAAPGLGYHYHWEVKPGIFQPGAAPPATPGGPTKPEPTKSDDREIKVILSPGESKEVELVIENAFKATSREVLPLSRPAPPTVIQMPQPGQPQPGQPGQARPAPPAAPAAPRGGAK